MDKKLIFGIYPGGQTGTDSSPELTTGKPDDPAQVHVALAKLQGLQPSFLVRCYMGYTGFGKTKNLTPENPIQYVKEGRKLDLVLCYQSVNGDMQDWTEFVRAQIVRYGKYLAKIQLTEEPNLHNVPAVDGDSPNVREAVIHGVIAAKQEIKQRGLAIEVGFNGVPTFDPNNDFWRELASLATPGFLDSLDYVGLDFFPDVFRPVPVTELKNSIGIVLRHYRNVSLEEAGIPRSVPIHITENGWATSPSRPEEKQADVLETIIRAIYEYRVEINITHYEMFDLRDADSSNPGIFYQFGIMRDDYSAKPVFEVFQKLIAELGEGVSSK